MKKGKSYRFIIVIALIALAGLLIVQINWFVKAYKLQSDQFDEKVTLALRSTTDQLLKTEGDITSGINPIIHNSSNSFYVDINHHITYSTLDSLIRKTFTEHNVLSPFELSVYENISNTVAFGNFYKDGVSSTAEATCLSRTLPAQTAMDFAITFPHKPSTVVGSLGVWIFSAFTFLLILVLFAFMIIDLTKRKRLAEVKADFINNMTHELQTPISNISIASEVLRKKGSSGFSEEKAAHYADIIYQESQRLKFQVEQVLQTAMLEKGKIEWQKSEVNLNSIIEEVVRIFQDRKSVV